MYDFRNLCGVIPPLLTQFTEQNEIDTVAIERHVAFLLDKGVDGLFVCGTNGEFITLSVQERQRLLECVTGQVRGRIPLIVHVTAPTLHDTLQLARHAVELGVEGIAVMPPWYYTFQEQDIFRWIGHVAQTFPDVSMLVYNIPQCNGQDVLPEWIDRWREVYPNIVGIKNSQEDASRAVMYSQKQDFNFLIGSDHLYLYTLMNGGRGAVSGLANFLPEPYVQLRDAFRRGDLTTALQMQHQIDEYTELLHGARIPYLKAGIEMRELGSRRCRAPHASLSVAAWEKWAQTWHQTVRL